VAGSTGFATGETRTGALTGETNAGVMTIAGTASVCTRLLIALSHAGVVAGLLARTGVQSNTGLVGVGTIPTIQWLRSPHQAPAIPKTYIEVKVIVMAHRLFLLK
jgi:hypothetical protein